VSLNQLLKGIKKNKGQKSVKTFLEKYGFSSTGEVTFAELMARIPESQCKIDNEGRKRVILPGEIYSLKIVDKLLANENLVDNFENVRFLSEYGLDNFLKTYQNEDETQDLSKIRFVSLNQLLKGIKQNNNHKSVRLFLEKYDFPLTGDIKFNELMNKIPEAHYVIDSEGRKRFKNPSGMWSLKILDELLS
jgi:Ca2+-binding EF-hand superfamily protein